MIFRYRKGHGFLCKMARFAADMRPARLFCRMINALLKKPRRKRMKTLSDNSNLNHIPVPPRISAVISAFNEERNIGDCIRSVEGLADEIVVADMSSDDKTAEIAESLGAAVHLVERRAFVDPTRNFAVSLAAGCWILVLDADERLTPALASELRAVAERDLADVVEVRFETYMFGGRIRYSGWQDTGRKTFFKKGFLTYPETEVHAHPAWKGRLLSLSFSKGAIVHYNYRDIRHFIAKMNDYTDGEALKLLKAGGDPNPLRGVYWGLRHSFRRYFLRFGYKVGWRGFMLSGFMGFYWFLAFCKAWELRLAGKIPAPGAQDGGRA
jgi:glycosyltransferase involved in cell wall biosynthesis